MNRRGFALLAVLWVLTALTALAGVALATSRVGWETTRNRMLLTRAAWAREACAEILLARYARRDSAQRVDTVDLGRGVWCQAGLEDPAARVNVNEADPPTLQRLLSVVGLRPAAVDSILAARRRGRIYDLRQVGLDPETRAALGDLLTTRGTGAIDVNTASPAVLRTLPGMSDEAIAVTLSRRAIGRGLGGLDELGGRLSPAGRARLYAEYQAVALHAVFSPPQLVATVSGGIHGTPLVARETLTLVPVPGRLAVIRREAE
jgi:hypothetical protein